MFCPHRQAVTFLLLGVGLQALAADAGNLSRKSHEPAGVLVPGCAENRVPPSLKPAEIDRYCRWVVRFRRADTPALPQREQTSEEQLVVESALTHFKAVQPAQIEGNRASVLTQTASGEFAVVSLEKREGVWTTVGVLNAPPAKSGRQR
jgi:hypothetical protein